MLFSVHSIYAVLIHIQFIKMADLNLTLLKWHTKLTKRPIGLNTHLNNNKKMHSNADIRNTPNVKYLYVALFVNPLYTAQLVTKHESPPLPCTVHVS